MDLQKGRNMSAKNYVIKKGNNVIGKEARMFTRNEDIWCSEISFVTLQRYIKKYSVRQLGQCELELIDAYDYINGTFYESQIVYNINQKKYLYKNGDAIYINSKIYVIEELYDFLPYLCKNANIGITMWFNVFDNMLGRMVYYSIKKKNKTVFTILSPDRMILQYDEEGMLLYRENIITGIKVIEC